MKFSFFDIVATADLTHVSLNDVLFLEVFFYQIFLLNDGNILVFSSLFVHINLNNQVKRFLIKLIEQFFS